MNAGTRIAVVGESLVDLVWRPGADQIRPVPGGSPANVATGLRRLGRPVTLVTSWGEDPPGELVARYLAGTGLDVVRAATASRRTTVALAYVDKESGSATYEFVPFWDPVDLPLGDDVRLLHTGSLAAVVAPGAGKVLDACERLHGRPGRAVSVDLNVRPAAQPDRAAYRAAVGRLCAVTDVVKASDEDLRWLWPDRDPADSARELLAFGPRLVVLTRGAEGAMACTPDCEASVTAPEVPVVDTIGAGDAFQSALLDSLLTEGRDGEPAVRVPDTPEELRVLLERPVVAGALATTRSGAQPPDGDELRAALEKRGARARGRDGDTGGA
ncbi:carbohydrate kinase [Streptomyces sp. NBC_01754]|uniref:carbohydrate kinase family protein n=1 Tax=Streptomyces sp. NBC_01754 TaxID=2975930 RepID=UPI002DDA601C|nr:carbohydrate kinase [Streptomyces sp. NBC_01754]WSC96372.1 carbohydrate kinase [Streptomyces sp. NBC_01754]